MLDRFERFSLAISEIDRCWHKLAAEETAKYDLNSAHAVYLNVLRQHEGGSGLFQTVKEQNSKNSLRKTGCF